MTATDNGTVTSTEWDWLYSRMETNCESPLPAAALNSLSDISFMLPSRITSPRMPLSAQANMNRRALARTALSRPSSVGDWAYTCSTGMRSEEHTSELQSRGLIS